MKKNVALVALACLLGLGGSALANIGTADVVPAATLLIPRFEVDVNDAGGVTTLFSVNNASAESVLAHVTLWTEWWIPILDFDVYLTGYDVQSFNVRDLVVNGVLPQTGAAPPFPAVGDFSAPHVNTFPGCSNVNGPTNYSPLSNSQIQLLIQAFTGQPVVALGGRCTSDPNGDIGLARGYITVDSVNNCGTDFPGDPGYFVDGGVGTANNNNVLWGDYFLVEPDENFAQGFMAVHIEADALVAACDNVNGFPWTFYCTVAALGEDDREALGSVYATRYLEGEVFDGGTSIIAWRDPRAPGRQSFPCAQPPPQAGQTQIVVFDEQENPLLTQESEPSIPGEVPEISPFPWCTNRAEVGVDIPVGEDFGWLYLNLNEDTGSLNQAYVTAVLDAAGRFSVGVDGLQLNGLTNGDGRVQNPTLPVFPPTLTATPSVNQP